RSRDARADALGVRRPFVTSFHRPGLARARRGLVHLAVTVLVLGSRAILLAWDDFALARRQLGASRVAHLLAGLADPDPLCAWWSRVRALANLHRCADDDRVGERVESEDQVASCENSDGQHNERANGFHLDQ